MTARTRLTLQQLDGRDLPSAVVVTVERPAEYATASIEWQQAFDLAVEHSLQGIVVDDTAPIVAVMNAPAPAAQVAPVPAGGRDFTPAEADEIIAINAQLNAIDAQLLQIEAAVNQLRQQQNNLRVVRERLSEAVLSH